LVVTSRKIDVESLLRFAKKVSFPAILAVPMIGGVVAVTWSSAETAPVLVEPSAAPAPSAESAPAGDAAHPRFRDEYRSQVDAEDDTVTPAAADSSTASRPGGLQQAALPPDMPVGDDEPAEAETLAEETEPTTVIREITVAPGDTLMKLLIDAGAEPTQAHQAIAAMEPVYSARRLMPGQELTVAFADTGEGAPGPLLSINFRPNRERDIEINRSTADDDFFAESIDRPMARQLAYARGSIESNLSVAATERNVPHPVLAEAIRAFSYDVDFQREIQKGDTFEFLYEIFVDENGELVRSGDLTFAAMTLSGSRTELYYYERADGNADFFTPEGASVRRSLMRTPIDGARLSSGFGMRKHPILGYSKMHRGTDFAAPSGTPIYAAGNGVVEMAGRNGGYGKYVRLRHGSNYHTAYAHMKSFAKGVTKGARVKQGQVIGYVGTTGRSTGPHLHYEVMVNGKQVNPLKVTLPRGEKLNQSELADFAEHRSRVERQLALAQGGVLMVKRACDPEDAPLEQGSAMDSDAC
jgi:murein DD-endopeptidase MepM/ murein hydrolase activator NlpD